MLPTSTLMNLLNGRARDRKAFSNNRLRDSSSHLPNLSYFAFGQLGFAIALAFWKSSLLRRIARVVACRAEKQMLRIHARPIVAAVAYIQPIRNVAIVHLVREAVGQFGMFDAVHGEGHTAIGACAAPRPARIRRWAIHLAPKEVCRSLFRCSYPRTLRHVCWNQRVKLCVLSLATGERTELPASWSAWLDSVRECRAAVLAFAGCRRLSHRLPMTRQRAETAGPIARVILEQRSALFARESRFMCHVRIIT